MTANQVFAGTLDESLWLGHVLDLGEQFLRA
jgi:hypothetical protein